ncbi:sulfatase-like hydrolase/transferase [Legionella dresdenensis]|uniref:Sulfatase-like hydrolase/transferase n=1 Tax=Legionella dresdenensis TaxID=450200 RepID=A0ABV8CFF4_9GAMM
MTENHGMKRYFNNFLIFNLFFFTLQLLYQLFRRQSFIHALYLPPKVYYAIAFTALVHILLCVVVSLLQAFMLWGIARHKISKNKLDYWQLAIFLLSVITIISLNCFYFPLSIFSDFFLPVIPISAIKAVIIISSIILSALFIAGLLQLVRHYPYQVLPLAAILFLAVTVVLFTRDNPAHFNTNPAKPNIIIIGVDSINPDNVNAHDTPVINEFLDNSVRFTDTISPLARTYPAWVSILTGRYPNHTQARENLMPQDTVNSNQSLAWVLQHQGYQTVYASDERRFNNIDKEYGFESITGPKIGVNEIILGSFNDFPLSNLLINTKIAKWLLPYNYLNRASYFAYYPNTFNQVLKTTLEQQNPNQPLFFAVHYTISHWPYAWAGTSPAEFYNPFDAHRRKKIYKQALAIADQQVGIMLESLKHMGLLQNSMVILLSDHGEVLFKPGSRKTQAKKYQGNSHTFVDYLARKTATPLEMSLGHGSDLLSPGQFQCLLGFKIYKNGQQVTKPKVISNRIALIDIAPTIAQFLNLTLPVKPDGISLLPTLLNPAASPAKRSIFLESAANANQRFTPESITQYAQSYYQVNPQSTLVEVRKEQISNLYAGKLFGIINQEWLVALYPDNNHYITVILRMTDGAWTDDPGSALAKEAPLQPMLAELKVFFNEVKNYPAVPGIRD